ncbi:glycosyltransferase family 39 protein [Sphaerisporangium sp. NPDC005288]|uniref:phospholipid carrier-dependent glycosyltransferase n=1 Tax=Sphaerisporangium sp. NPDC005288 TaxID=3155114 RepID=UPI0033BB4115
MVASERGSGVRSGAGEPSGPSSGGRVRSWWPPSGGGFSSRWSSERAGGRLWGGLRAHRWFLGVLGLGVALRVVTMLGYRPVLWFPDSYTYVVTALRPRPDLVRPAGYSMFLRLLEPFHSFGFVAFVQHLLGAAIGVLVYAAVRRAGGRVWAATLAAAPVLLDAYQVQLEHLLVSDTLFAFLLVAAMYVLLGRPRWRAVCLAGALLGAATLTRTVGLPLLAVVAVWLLVRRPSREPLVRRPRKQTSGADAAGAVWPPVGRPGEQAPAAGRAVGARGVMTRAWRRAWRRARPAAVLVLVALVPIAGYAAWFWATYHRVGIVGSNGVFLYGRTMSFADCSVMRPPRDLAVLCDDRPPSRRPPSQEYVWAPDAPLVALPGITFTQETDRLAGRFALLALRSQPLDYAASVLSELARSFTPNRPVYPDQEIYDYYEFPARTPPPPGRYPATYGASLAVRYERGPIGTRVVEPLAGWTRAYQDVVWLPGTALLAVLLLPPGVAAGRAWRSRARRRAEGPGASRTAWAPPWVMAVSLLVIPAATAEFDYRYVLPAVPLAFLSAGLLTARQTDRS